MHAPGPVQLDALLLPFVQEKNDAESEGLLAYLVAEHAEPLNQTGDYRTMVNGFMNSIEYRQRFNQ